MMASDIKTDYYDWKTIAGEYVLEATPYTQDNALGNQGILKEIKFRVVGSSLEQPGGGGDI